MDLHLDLAWWTVSHLRRARGYVRVRGDGPHAAGRARAARGFAFHEVHEGVPAHVPGTRSSMRVGGGHETRHTRRTGSRAKSGRSEVSCAPVGAEQPRELLHYVIKYYSSTPSVRTAPIVSYIFGTCRRCGFERTFEVHAAKQRPTHRKPALYSRKTTRLERVDLLSVEYCKNTV